MLDLRLRCLRAPELETFPRWFSLSCCATDALSRSCRNGISPSLISGWSMSAIATSHGLCECSRNSQLKWRRRSSLHSQAEGNIIGETKLGCRPTADRLFLIVPADVDKSSTHMAWQPNIDAGQAIDPARLKFSNRISRHLIQQSLEYQELVVGTDRLGNLSIEGPFIQAVVNSLHGLVHVVRVFLGDLNILPSSGIGEVAADKVLEFVGEDFVEHLQIFVEVGR